MATGKDDSGNPCSACLGNGRKLEFVEQDWRRFAKGTLEEYFALGPVTAMVAISPPGAGDESGIVNLVAEPDFDGNFPMILLEKPESSDGRMYLFGGRLRQAR